MGLKKYIFWFLFVFAIYQGICWTNDKLNESYFSQFYTVEPETVSSQAWYDDVLTTLEEGLSYFFNEEDDKPKELYIAK